ncbi:MAG TPA: hypothetical protein VGL13_13185, partial [Polyangiaceae bacterium]
MTPSSLPSRSLLAALLLAGGTTLLTFGACSSDDRPTLKALAEGCIINTDCDAPLVCAFRKCHTACSDSRDCPLGERCVASDRPYHVCQLDDERNCLRNSDCVEGEVCGVDFQCRDQCATTRDCLRDQACVSGTCSDLLKDEGGVDLPDAGSDASQGQPCVYTSECPSPLVCMINVCSYECLAASDCPSGQDCVNNRCVAGSGTLIGPQGGSLTTGGGKLSLTVPAGALRSSVAIDIVPLEAWPEGALGTVVDIQPSGLLFATPATLTYRYDASEIGATPAATLHLAAASGSSWNALSSTVDTAAQTVSAPL